MRERVTIRRSGGWSAIRKLGIPLVLVWWLKEIGEADVRCRMEVVPPAKSFLSRVELVECALQLFQLLPSFAELTFRR